MWFFIIITKKIVALKFQIIYCNAHNMHYFVCPSFLSVTTLTCPGKLLISLQQYSEVILLV